jgi:hypothetical protein
VYCQSGWTLRVHYLSGVSYEAFRNLVVEKIALSNYRPDNKRQVLQSIVDA